MSDAGDRVRGVDYDALDPVKVKASRAGRETGDFIKRLGVAAAEETRGESVFLYLNDDHFIAHVNEGLGTKNLVADAIEESVPVPSYYDSLAQDTVAMIVNDMITLGAFPFGVAMHLAIGDEKWMKNDVRLDRLIMGWKMACVRSNCHWGGGETPVLKGVVHPDCAVLSGSAVGKTIGYKRFYARNVVPGDVIILFESSGIHANGLTDVRRIAPKLERQYFTEIPGTGKTFGELLLEPTHLYVNAVEKMVRSEIDIHYAVNITGHGWRKLMRAPQALTYVIETLPASNPLFTFIQEHGEFSDRKMFETFNMGAGFGIFVPEDEVLRIEKLTRKYSFPFRVFRAGHVEAGEKRVIIEPKGITFEGETLAIR